MLFHVLQKMFSNTFFARFILFFGVGMAFAKLTRTQRQLHDWSIWRWDVGELAYTSAATSLSFWLFGLFLASAYVVRRDMKRRGELK